MSRSALAKEEPKLVAARRPPKPMPILRAPASPRPCIKIYTGGSDVKAMIEKMAEDDRPGQGASAYLLKLVWREKKRLAST